VAENKDEYASSQVERIRARVGLVAEVARNKLLYVTNKEVAQMWSTKLLTWVLGGAVVAAAAVGASVPNDSMIQNLFIDKSRPKQGQLIAVKDSLPLGEREGIILVLGLNDSQNPNGPSEEQLRFMTEGIMPELETDFGQWTDGEDFHQYAKVYGIWYNSNATAVEVGDWIDGLIESNPELTGKNVRFCMGTHSFGGPSVRCYEIKTDGRKIDHVSASAPPFVGALFADKDKTDQAITAGVPGLMGEIAKMAKNQVATKRKIQFDALGMQWLRPGAPEMTALWREHPLDDSWTLLMGETEPVSGKVETYLAVTTLIDRIFLESGQDQDPQAYRLGAYLIQASGKTCRSDGVVDEDSVAGDNACVGQATIVLLSQHNHSQMWWGNSGQELWREMLRPMMPYILARKAKLKPSAHFDLWLPPTDFDLDLPTQDFGRLKLARMVWVNLDGRLVVADESADNPTELNLVGKFSWPQWMGDDLVVTWHHGGKSDIMLIPADGNTKLLTTDGMSGPAGVGDDGLVVWVSQGNVMVWRRAQAIAKVVAHGATVDTPPVIFNGRVYLACQSVSGYELRSVQLSANDQLIATAKLEEAGLTQPMKVGVALLALKSDGDMTRLAVVSQWWTGVLDKNIQNFVKLQYQENVPSLESIDFDDQSGAVYLVCGGSQIVQLNTGIVLQSLTQQVAVDDWTTLAPQIATGVQLDVK
jgi:hypothetical protein